MTAISVTKVRENIYQILSDVNNSSQPITITNNRGKNGVLISEDEAGKEPLEECSVFEPDEEW